MDKLKHNIKKEYNLIKENFWYKTKIKLYSYYRHLKGSMTSWTVNINLILLLTVYIEENSKVFKQYFSVEADFNTFILLITITNIILRFKTTDSLKDKADKQDEFIEDIIKKVKDK